MATIGKRVLKSGEVTYYAKCRRKGLQTQSKTFSKHSDAITWARQIERSFDTGEALGIGAAERNQHAATTLGDVLEKFRDEVCSTLRGGKTERERIDLFLKQRWIRTPALELTPAILAKVRDDRLKDVSAGTVLCHGRQRKKQCRCREGCLDNHRYLSLAYGDVLV